VAETYIAKKQLKIGDRMVQPGEVVDCSDWARSAVRANLAAGHLERAVIPDPEMGLGKQQLRLAVMNSLLPNDQKTRLLKMLGKAEE
jgi:hypothetical protein